MVVAKSNEELKHLISEVQKGKLKLEEINVSEIQDFSEVFKEFTFDPKYGSIEDWDVSKGVNFKSMFQRAKGMSLLNLSKWKLSNAINCNYMFDNCLDFKGGDLSNWNPVNLKSAEGMFKKCENFKGIGLDKWHLPSLINASMMFEECINFDQDLSNWGCQNLESLYSMFKNCSKFRGIGLEKWNITLIKDKLLEVSRALDKTFENCIKFDADLSSWKIKGYFCLNSTFKNCKSFKGKGLEKWELIPRDESRILPKTFQNCLKLDFNKSPNWKFYKPLGENVYSYYLSFSNAISLTTVKFLDPTISIYDSELLNYYEGKNFYKHKQTYGFYSVEDLPDNITFNAETRKNNINELMNPELSLPNLKKPVSASIEAYLPTMYGTTIRKAVKVNFKLSSKRIQLKKVDKSFLEPFKKDYGNYKTIIPLNVKYGKGPFGYPLAKKVETILPKISYYKLIQKIPAYEDNKIQTPNTVLAKAQKNSPSEKLFFNTKNIFFNKNYFKCFFQIK